MTLITIMGYTSLFLTTYNIACGMINRLAGNDDAAKASGLEASIWFIAATVCFK